MPDGAQFQFAGFRLDPANAQVWRGKTACKLKPKAFEVLRYLVEHAGQLVTKDELWRAVWPEVVVTEGVLTTCLSEIRQALGDKATAPRFIETVHRRGYRFIAAVQSSRFKVQSSQSAIRNPLRPGPSSGHTINMVGRETELAQLHKWLEKALRGERQIVFVTGEVGIGKTTVVDAFLAQTATREQVWIGRGQCIDHYGAGEPYLPVLEAFGRLGREPGGERLLALLNRYAPTWLVQMPALLSAAELAAVQKRVTGATRERMLREMVEAVEALSTERGLILLLEDLQWSDVSTLDWLAVLARRQERARLLVLGTYRPVDVIVREHPLKAVKQDLQVHGQCAELALGLLTEAAVAEYLAVRFSPVGARGAFQQLAQIIHQRTDGNPLFMVNLVDYLVAQGVLVPRHEGWEVQPRLPAVVRGVPEGLRQMIETQLDRLPPEERRVLEVASVAGADFSAAAVAAGIEQGIEAIEEHCEALARRGHFLRAQGTEEWPDGTLAAHYGFQHALYQAVLYERLTARQRLQVHRRIGERKERAYGNQAREIATELAVHFERGRDYHRAVQYLRLAGENAIRRSAYVEAISHLTKGLELLKILPDTPERTQQELMLQIALGASLMVTQGYTAPEVGKVYTRARELCQQVGDILQLIPALWGLYNFYAPRGELQTARELAEQLFTLAQRGRAPASLLRAHQSLGITLFFLGEVASARVHFEQAIALYHSLPPSSQAFLYSGADPGVSCLSYAGSALWVLGYPDQALKRGSEALTLAQGLSHPFSLAFAFLLATLRYQLRRERHATQAQAVETITFTTEHGFSYFLTAGILLRGWALAEQGQGEEGIAQIRQGLAVFRAAGAGVGRSHYLALLAEAYGRAGQREEGLSALAEALAHVEKNGERFYEAELYRLKGELTLQQFNVQGSTFKVANPQPLTPNTQHPTPSTHAEAEAEACFQKAIDIARRQSAKSWELRVAMSLSRLWQRQGKKKDAHQMLAEIYGWFTEGFDTTDLQEARVLLTEPL